MALPSNTSLTLNRQPPLSPMRAADPSELSAVRRASPATRSRGQDHRASLNGDDVDAWQFLDLTLPSRRASVNALLLHERPEPRSAAPSKFCRRTRLPDPSATFCVPHVVGRLTMSTEERAKVRLSLFALPDTIDSMSDDEAVSGRWLDVLEEMLRLTFDDTSSLFLCSSASARETQQNAWFLCLPCSRDFDSAETLNRHLRVQHSDRIGEDSENKGSPLDSVLAVLTERGLITCRLSGLATVQYEMTTMSHPQLTAQQEAHGLRIGSGTSEANVFNSATVSLPLGFRSSFPPPPGYFIPSIRTVQTHPIFRNLPFAPLGMSPSTLGRTAISSSSFVSSANTSTVTSTSSSGLMVPFPGAGSSAMQQQHTSRNANKNIKCPHCNWHYKYAETLANHIKDKHPSELGNEAGANMTLTGIPSVSDSAPQCHHCLHHLPHPRLSRGESYPCGYKPYRCDVCDYSTTTKGNLAIHKQSDKHLNNVARERSRSGVSSSVVGGPPMTIDMEHGLMMPMEMKRSSSPPQQQSALVLASMAHAPIFDPRGGSPWDLNGFRKRPSSPHFLAEAKEGNPEEADVGEGPLFQCAVCETFSSDSLDRMAEHMEHAQQITAAVEVETVAQTGEKCWTCRICPYQSSLKANFQLHCKTDKHLQRQRFLAHLSLGCDPGASANAFMRMEAMVTAGCGSVSPVLVRCRLCGVVVNAIEKMRVHISQGGHEAAIQALALIEVQERDKRAGAKLLYACLVCSWTTSNKLELLRHVANSEHMHAMGMVQPHWRLSNSPMYQVIDASEAPVANMDTVKEETTADADEPPSKTKRTDKEIVHRIPCPLCGKAKKEGAMEKHLIKVHSTNPSCLNKIIQLVNGQPMDAEPSDSHATDQTREEIQILLKNSEQHHQSDNEMSENMILTKDPNDEDAQILLLPDEPVMEDNCCRCHFCGSNFKSVKNLFEHMSELRHIDRSDPSGRYLCWKIGCNQYFSKLEALKLHFGEIHVKKSPADVTSALASTLYPHACPCCPLAFRSLEACRSHGAAHARVLAGGLGGTICVLCFETVESSIRHHLEKEHLNSKTSAAAEEESNGAIFTEQKTVTLDDTEANNNNNNNNINNNNNSISNESSCTDNQASDINQRLNADQKSCSATNSVLSSSAPLHYMDMSQHMRQTSYPVMFPPIPPPPLGLPSAAFMPATPSPGLNLYWPYLMPNHILPTYTPSPTPLWSDYGHHSVPCDPGLNHHPHLVPSSPLDFPYRPSMMSRLGNKENSAVLCPTPVQASEEQQFLHHSLQQTPLPINTEEPVPDKTKFMRDPDSYTRLLEQFGAAEILMRCEDLQQKKQAKSVEDEDWSSSDEEDDDLSADKEDEGSADLDLDAETGMATKRGQPFTGVVVPGRPFACSLCKMEGRRRRYRSLFALKLHREMKHGEFLGDGRLADVVSWLRREAKKCGANFVASAAADEMEVDEKEAEEKVEKVEVKEEIPSVQEAKEEAVEVKEEAKESLPERMEVDVKEEEAPAAEKPQETSAPSLPPPPPPPLIPTRPSHQQLPAPQPPLSVVISKPSAPTEESESRANGLTQHRHHKQSLSEEQRLVLRRALSCLTAPPSDEWMDELGKRMQICTKVIRKGLRTMMEKERMRHHADEEAREMDTQVRPEGSPAGGRSPSVSSADSCDDSPDLESSPEVDQAWQGAMGSPAMAMCDASISKYPYIYRHYLSYMFSHMQQHEQPKPQPAPQENPAAPLPDCSLCSISSSSSASSSSSQLSSKPPPPPPPPPPEPLCSPRPPSAERLPSPDKEKPGLSLHLASSPGPAPAVFSVASDVTATATVTSTHGLQQYHRRVRTTINNSQLSYLLSCYEKDSNPSKRQQEAIATRTGLPRRVVQVWFQNTRARDRKGTLRGLAAPPVSVQVPVSLASLEDGVVKHCVRCTASFRSQAAYELHILRCRPRISPPAPPALQLSSQTPLLPPVMPRLSLAQPPFVPHPVDLTKDAAERQPGPSESADQPLDLSTCQRVRTSPELTPASTPLQLEPESPPSAGTSPSIPRGVAYFSNSVALTAANNLSNLNNNNNSKRSRTNISPFQLRMMREIFPLHKMPTVGECETLGKKIGLSRRVVQVWFQNQRAKEKKSVREGCGMVNADRMDGIATPSLTAGCLTREACSLCSIHFDPSGSGGPGGDEGSLGMHLFSLEHLSNLGAFLEQCGVQQHRDTSPGKCLLTLQRPGEGPLVALAASQASAGASPTQWLSHSSSPDK